MNAQIDQSNLAAERSEAISATMARIREIESNEGVQREALSKIRDELLNLAAREEFFTEADYPSSVGEAINYLISEDSDHRYALYLSSGRPGRGTPPHNHTTWAVIVGIDGYEENRIYDRIDDGSVDKHGEVKQREKFMVEKGTGICFMPDDIHSIHVTGDVPTRNFHLYGLSTEHLPNRIMFNMKDDTYKVFPATRGIIKGEPPFEIAR